MDSTKQINSVPTIKDISNSAGIASCAEYLDGSPHQVTYIDGFKKGAEWMCRQLIGVEPISVETNFPITELQYSTLKRVEYLELLDILKTSGETWEDKYRDLVIGINDIAGLSIAEIKEENSELGEEVRDMFGISHDESIVVTIRLLHEIRDEMDNMFTPRAIEYLTNFIDTNGK